MATRRDSGGGGTITITLAAPAPAPAAAAAAAAVLLIQALCVASAAAITALDAAMRQRVGRNEGGCQGQTWMLVRRGSGWPNHGQGLYPETGDGRAAHSA